MGEPPDDRAAELVSRARRGDREALRELVEDAYPLVRRWALVHTGDPADADDLTQDVVVQMIQRLESFRGTARFSTWIYSVTRNAALDRARAGAYRARPETRERVRRALEPESPGDPEAELDRSLLGDLLRAFFDELPERQRQVFDLAELQGLPSDEVGARLGIAPGSVRATLFKARRTLRRRLLESHPDLAGDIA